MIAKYALLTGGGVLLYILAAKYALAERGYFAMGGEGLLLLLPVFHSLIKAVLRDAIIKNRSRNSKREGKR